MNFFTFSKQYERALALLSGHKQEQLRARPGGGKGACLLQVGEGREPAEREAEGEE